MQAQMLDTAQIERNLKRFDELVFDALNKRNWELFRDIHSDDVVVVMWDGSKTVGVDAHINAMKQFLVNADLKVTAHPIKLGQGEWTAVTGETTANLPNGQTINGTTCSVARWRRNRIIEKHIFLDTAPIIKMLTENNR